MCQLAGAVVASVAISAEAVSAKAVVASVGAVATFIRAAVGMFSPYIILVSNRLVDWYFMKF